MKRRPVFLKLDDAGLARGLETLLPAYLPVDIAKTSGGAALLVAQDAAGVPLDHDGPVVFLPAPPLRLGVLLDRIAARLRQGDAAIVVFGPYRLEPADLDLRRGDAPVIRLTEKEAALLRHLHAAAGAPVERAILLTAIWGYADGLDTHTLETHVYRLRQKLEDDPAAPRWLLTDGSGYRLARG